MSSSKKRIARDASGNEIKPGARAHRLWFWGTVVSADADVVRLRFDDDCPARNLAGDTGIYRPGDVQLVESVQTSAVLIGGES